jgi:hypothetical protein
MLIVDNTNYIQYEQSTNWRYKYKLINNDTLLIESVLNSLYNGYGIGGVLNYKYYYNNSNSLDKIILYKDNQLIGTVRKNIYNESNNLIEKHYIQEIHDDPNIYVIEFYKPNEKYFYKIEYHDWRDTLKRREYFRSTSFKYRYDSRRNWFKKYLYTKEGNLYKVIRREIEYYN